MRTEDHDIVRAAIRLSLVDESAEQRTPPVLIGGAPNLPEEIDWPLGCHFVAQIHLGAFPVRISHNGSDFELPRSSVKARSLSLCLSIRIACLEAVPSCGILPRTPEPYLNAAHLLAHQTCMMIPTVLIIGKSRIAGRMLLRKYAALEGFLFVPRPCSTRAAKLHTERAV